MIDVKPARDSLISTFLKLFACLFEIEVKPFKLSLPILLNFVPGERLAKVKQQLIRDQHQVEYGQSQLQMLCLDVIHRRFIFSMVLCGGWIHWLVEVWRCAVKFVTAELEI